MERVVYLHVGAPKTGTTYLQDRLARNTLALARHGVRYPAGSPLGDPSLFQFRAAVDLLGKDWSGPGEKSSGKWAQLSAQVRRRQGSVVISHELFAGASAEVIEKAKTDLGVGAGTELHIVYSARDLGRQVPAAWQESVKQGQTWTYRAFCRRMRRRKGWFARTFDLPSVLTAWGDGLPAEQVHVVTVPQERQGDVLWRRFCTALALDPSWARRETQRSNPSLGAAEASLLRRLNTRLDRRGQIGSYDFLIRELVAERELVGRQPLPVTLPERLRGWAEEESERWIEWIASSGARVHGDPAELRPAPQPVDARVLDPDRPGARIQLGAALDALAAMTREAERRPDPDRHFAAKLRHRIKELSR
ncbi:hypothetical protein [Nocardioides insulae]|uniref:hypothetical protein n=1 Tax=Nocardioides insulae TaxID=394734 RepID=UPI00048B8926|nr:hypothetical protein [Nocardioides insulae]